MPKLEITTTELVWPGKYNEDGTRAEVPRVNLPFQVIETVNESRATREARKEGIQGGLFDVYEGKEGDTFEAGWRNKLIWGDNLLVMGSLLHKFSGKFDLIYIDPPFATGSDFSFAAPIGEGGTEVLKEQSIIEEKAYRDTWGMGIESYLGMLYARLYMIRELLSDRGTLYVHLDWHVGHYVKAILDELFGPNAFTNEIVWRRTNAHNSRNAFGQIHDVIFRYIKSPDATFNVIRTPYAKAYIEGRFTRKDERGLHDSGDLTGPGVRSGDSGLPWWGFDPTTIGRHWQPPKSLYEQLGEDISHLPLLERLEYLNKKGYIIPPAEPGNAPRAKVYAGEGLPLQDIWSYQPHTKGHLTNGSEVDGDVAWLPAGHPERMDYDTQKPAGLLQRIISASSKPGDLVGDFFCGSGTTCAVAEKLGRRWIGCDLGRWALHVSRKRLLSIEDCKPFEILNLGMYERQYWQGVTFGEAKDKPLTERALYEYLAFILKLYGAQPLAGLTHIHGKKSKALVHIGAVDAPVTIAEIDAAISECGKLKQGELHVLGWEWEMGLYDLMVEAAKKKGVKLLLLQIPREVMEQQAVTKGDIRFFELAYLEAEIRRPNKLTAQVALKDFVIPNTELIPEDVRNKVKKWSDYIDYWAVDWNFQNDTFMQGWVAYRMKGDRKLAVISDPYTYDKPGKRRILLKVIDIFGNDTSQAFNVEVK